LASNSAVASHGKVGLWRITSTVELGASTDAKMSAAATKIRAHSFSADHCMSHAEASTDALAQPTNKNCRLTNAKGTALNYSADIICTGDHGGTAHVTAKYDGPEHFSGTSIFIAAGSTIANAKTMFEGRWIRADCGKVTQ
jgi:hypothetical protein